MADKDFVLKIMNKQKMKDLIRNTSYKQRENIIVEIRKEKPYHEFFYQKYIYGYIEFDDMAEEIFEFNKKIQRLSLN